VISKKIYPYVLTVPALVAAAILVLYPLGYLCFLSLHSWKGGRAIFVGLTNFVSMLPDEDFWKSLRITAMFLVGAVSVEFILGLVMALLVSRITKHLVTLFRLLILLPWVIPPVVGAMVFRMLFDPLWGAVNYVLSWVGIESIGWTIDPTIALGAIMIADVWRWTSFMFLLLTAGIQSLPIEVFEASTMDGASSLQRFRHITIPMLRNVIIVAFMFRLIDAFQSFDIIYMITRGGPGTSTTTLNNYTFQTAFQRSVLGYGSSLAVIMLIIVLVIVGIIARLGRIAEI